MSSSKHEIIIEGVDRTQGAFRSVATGLSQLATSAFSLYQTYEGIERASVALDRANLMLTRSTESLDQSQKNYNETVAKYGVGSAEAKDAADKLAIASDALSLATERQNLAQSSLNDSYTRLALSIVPTVISSFDGISKLLTTLSGKTKGLSTDLSDAFTGLGGAGGAAGAGGVGGLGGVGGVGAGGGAAVGGGLLGASAAIGAITAVALTPLLADFAGRQEEAIRTNPDLKSLMLIRGGGAMPTGTNPWTSSINTILNKTVQTQATTTAIQATTTTVLENLVADMGWYNAPEFAGLNTEEIISRYSRFQRGGIAMGPTLAMVGEGGPEAIVPLNQSFGGGVTEITIKIEGPVVQIMGDASRQTAAMAASMVQETLKNITLTASSSAADATHKKIQVNNTVVTNAGGGAVIGGQSPRSASFNVHRERFRE